MSPVKTLSVLAALALLAPAAARAAPVLVDVRIVGSGRTLFEGPLRAEGHEIRAASDSQARQCNGLNAGANPQAGATATAAAVDAMSLIGESFDGHWDSGRDDYFITRWGPEAERAEAGEAWGLIVDGTLSAKGGCQVELAEGQQIIWLYDAFQPRRLLTLRPLASSAGNSVPIATVALGEAMTVLVESRQAGAQPSAQAGALVSPVGTAANGFETPITASPQTLATGGAGTATFAFDEPGWHRLMATAPDMVDSNRLDVCVPAPAQSGCGALPVEDQVRSLAAVAGGGGEPTGRLGGEPAGDGSGPVALTPAGAPAGVVVAGRRLLAIDDRSPRLRYRGRWRRTRARAALDGTLTVGEAGASVAVRMGAGGSAFILRGIRGRARVELFAGGRRRTVTLADAGAAHAHLAITPVTRRAGSVEMLVLSGSVGLDGVAPLT